MITKMKVKMKNLSWPIVVGLVGGWFTVIAFCYGAIIGFLSAF